MEKQHHIFAWSMCLKKSFISPYCIQDVPFTHCLSSWVLPQLPILFLQLIPYRALHPETREALTKWGIIRLPLMQVKNTFDISGLSHWKLSLFEFLFSRKSNMCGDGQTDAEEMFAGIQRAALDSPDGDKQLEESWRAGNRFTSAHDRLWHVQMSVRCSLWTLPSLMCTMSTQRACVCLRVPALAHDKGTWLCTCSAFSTVRQQIPLPLNLWYIHKGLYKSIGCDG